jgi:uncharacterized membrane protein YGL010W
MVVVTAVVLYDCLLSPRLALSFAIFLVLSYYLARPLPSFVLWAGFLLGWGLQFLGHYAYEGKSPAFFKNLEAPDDRSALGGGSNRRRAVTFGYSVRT